MRSEVSRPPNYDPRVCGKPGEPKKKGAAARRRTKSRKRGQAILTDSVMFSDVSRKTRWRSLARTRARFARLSSRCNCSALSMSRLDRNALRPSGVAVCGRTRNPPDATMSVNGGATKKKAKKKKAGTVQIRKGPAIEPAGQRGCRRGETETLGPARPPRRPHRARPARRAHVGARTASGRRRPPARQGTKGGR